MSKKGGLIVMIYTQIQQIPEDYQWLIQRMVKDGIIDVDLKGHFSISEDMLKIIIILARLGLW